VCSNLGSLPKLVREDIGVTEQPGRVKPASASLKRGFNDQLGHSWEKCRLLCSFSLMLLCLNKFTN
jgi:hypothetical protein